MHSFDSVGASMQKSISTDDVRESAFSDTVEGLSVSPGGQSYVKMNPAGKSRKWAFIGIKSALLPVD